MDPPGMVHPRFRKWSFFYKFSYSYLFFFLLLLIKTKRKNREEKGIRKIPQEGFLIFIVVKEKGLTRKICQKLVIFLSFLHLVFYYGIFIVSDDKKKREGCPTARDTESNIGRADAAWVPDLGAHEQKSSVGTQSGSS